MSDFIKIMNLNYYFHPDMLEKNLQFLVPLSIFCGLGNLCLDMVFMILGNPSSKCQKVWFQIRLT